MLPMELEPDEADTLDFISDDHEARFYTCHVCGDNWLTVRRVEDGDCRITFVHQMGLQPLLKRTAHMSTPVLLNEDTVERWARRPRPDGPHAATRRWQSSAGSGSPERKRGAPGGRTRPAQAGGREAQLVQIDRSTRRRSSSVSRQRTSGTSSSPM